MRHNEGIKYTTNHGICRICVLRILRSIIPFEIFSYQPRGRRSLGRPFKHSHENVTGHWAYDMEGCWW